MNYDLWINKALLKIGALERGKEFVLKDLFFGTEWNELSRGERLNLGRKFKAAVENRKVPNIMLIESPKGTATTYKKVK